MALKQITEWARENPDKFDLFFGIDLASPFDAPYHWAWIHFDNIAHFYHAACDGAEKFRDIERAYYTKLDTEEALGLKSPRKRDPILEALLDGQTTRQVREHASHMTVVAMWANTEKYINILLDTCALKIDDENYKRSHKWENLEKNIKRYGVNPKAAPMFQDAMLCRLVNNAIKHGGVVERDLAKTPEFSPYANKEIPALEPYLQNFICGCLSLLSFLRHGLHKNLLMMTE